MNDKIKNMSENLKKEIADVCYKQIMENGSENSKDLIELCSNMRDLLNVLEYCDVVPK